MPQPLTPANRARLQRYQNAGTLEQQLRNRPMLRNRYRAGGFDMMSAPNPTPAAPAAAPPAPNPTPQMTLPQMLQQFVVPQSPQMAGMQNYLSQGFNRLGALPTPSYEDMFSRWMTTANREADRQAADLTEAFGARGARYGGDILNAQRDLRERNTQNIATMADTISRGLNQDRVNEQGQLGQLSLGAGQLDQSRLDNAMQYLFADYLRRTSPPPLLVAAGQYASTPGYGDTIIS